jgi:hypothetical protein
MKRILLLIISILFTFNIAHSQCTWSGSSGASVGKPPCGSFGSRSVGSGSYTFWDACQGDNYTMSTCGSPFDTQLTWYRHIGSWISQVYNDDNGPDCGGAQASMDFLYTHANSTNNIMIVNRYNCQQHDFTGQSALLKYRNNGPSAPTAAPGNGGTSCGSRTLTAGTPPYANVRFYWQTSSSGTSGLNFQPTQTVTSTSTWYLRAYNTCSGCWGGSSAGTAVTIQSSTNNQGAVYVSPSTICVGGSAAVLNTTAATTGTPSSGSPSYYHYYKLNNTGAWVMYNGPTSSTTSVLPSAVINAVGTHNLARNSSFPCDGVQTNNANTIDFFITVVADPTISSSGGGTICVGDTRALSSSSSGGTGTCTYQWQISTAGSGGPFSNISGATNSTYNTGALAATRWYQVQRTCSGTGCGGAATSNVQTVTVIPPPSIGTYAYPNLYTCGSTGDTYSSSGNIVTNSISGYSGTITWYWGTAAGAWNTWGSGANAPGSCCFPLNSSGASRMRADAVNEACTVSGATVLVISENMVAPTSAASTSTSICNGSPATITLSYSGGVSGVLGEAKWYSSSCGGTLIGSGNNVTVTSPTISTTYFVRFENPCTQTSCASIFVSVPQIELSALVTDLSCYNNGSGAIDLSVIQTPSTFGNSLTQWVSADQGVVTNTSDDVIRWQDLSGNENHYNITVGSGAKLQASSMNGEPAVRFNNSAIMNSPNFVTSPYTMFVVGKMNGGSSRRLVSSGSINWLIGWYGGNHEVMYAGASWVQAPWAPPGNLTDSKLYSTTSSGSLTSFYRNGSLVATSVLALPAPGIISLGGSTIYPEQSNGDVAEVLVYNKVLSDGERQEVENYLNKKYAVSVASGTETYLWNPGGETTDDLSSLDAGTYSVTLTKDGCIDYLSGITVEERDEIATSGIIVNEVCPSDNNGSVTPQVIANKGAEPSAFPDLLIWTKGDRGVVKDLEGNVLIWKDLSGLDNHFYTDFGKGVQEISASIGGETAIRFDGSNIMKSQQVINTDFTVITVAKMNGGGSLRLISSATRNWLHGWWQGNMNQFYSDGWVSAAGGTPANTTPYIYTTTGDIGSDSYALYTDGSLTASSNGGSQPPGSLSLGGWGTGNTEGSNGDVAEVIAYNRVLTANERMAVEKYLSDKYGISGPTGVDPTFSWSPGGASTEDISGLDGVSYTLTTTDAAGCADSEIFVVGTDKTESTAVSGISGALGICNGDSTTLSVVGGSLGTGAVWNWYSGSCGGTFVGTGSPITVSPSSSTTYFVRAQGDCNTTGCLTGTAVVEVYSINNNAYLVSGETTSAVDVCEEGPWTYYAEPSDPDKYIFGVKKNANTFTAQVTINDLPGNATYSSTGGAGPDRGTWLLGRYWNVELTSGSITTDVDIRFFLDAGEITQAQNEANTFLNSTAFASNITPLIFFKTTGTNFNPTTGLQAGNFTFTPTYLAYSVGAIGGVTFVEMTGLTSFSGGTGGFSVNDDGSTLPVELLSFEANAIDNEYIQLDWATATEVNNDGFELMRSEDGVNFERIAWIEGNGNSAEINEYTFDDENVRKGIIYYYQLKQVDYDGQSEIFDVVSAGLEGKNEFFIGNIVPNPSKENNRVRISVQSTREVLVSIQIYNHVGMQVASLEQDVYLGENKLDIDISEFAAGTYFMSFESTFGTETRKLVVIK